MSSSESLTRASAATIEVANQRRHARPFRVCSAPIFLFNIVNTIDNRRSSRRVRWYTKQFSSLCSKVKCILSKTSLLEEEKVQKIKGICWPGTNSYAPRHLERLTLSFGQKWRRALSFFPWIVATATSSSAGLHD